jgi:four helix bundle protein
LPSANDVGYANDVHFVNDVAIAYVFGKHHIIATIGSNIIMLRITSFRLWRYIIKSSHDNQGVRNMKENKLAELSIDFSIDMINLVKYLKANHESIISNQIGRSGTSIGANIHEAQYAQGKKDFISKLEIALKEASETGYWLILLYRTNYIDEHTYKTLSSKCASLRVMLIASCKTAKENK